MTVHKGGCHCGRIRFEVEAPAELELHDCNCSICNMSGYQHLIVAKSAFTLTAGGKQLGLSGGVGLDDRRSVVPNRDRDAD